MTDTIELTQTQPTPFDEYSIKRNEKETGCHLCFGDLHGIAYFLYYPSGNYLRLNPDKDNCLKMLQHEWADLESAAVEENGLDCVADLYEID